MKAAAISILFLVLTLVGCGTSPKRQQALNALRAEIGADLASAPPCCEDNNGFGQVTEINGTSDILLSKDSPIREFEEGRSHFLVLRVPQADSSFFLRIFETPNWVERFGLVWPIVLLLDENFKVLKKDALDRHDESWMSQIPSPMRRIEVNPKTDRYAVIYTDPTLFGRETIVQWELGLATASIKAPYVPTGVLRFTFHKKGLKCGVFSDSKSCLVSPVLP